MFSSYCVYGVDVDSRTDELNGKTHQTSVHLLFLASPLSSQCPLSALRVWGTVCKGPNRPKTCSSGLTFYQMSQWKSGHYLFKSTLNPHCHSLAFDIFSFRLIRAEFGDTKLMIQLHFRRSWLKCCWIHRERHWPRAVSSSKSWHKVFIGDSGRQSSSVTLWPVSPCFSWRWHWWTVSCCGRDGQSGCGGRKSETATLLQHFHYSDTFWVSRDRRNQHGRQE